MTPRRLAVWLLLALSLFLSLFAGPASAQTSYEYGYVHRKTGVTMWGQASAQDACLHYSQSVVDWWAMTYPTFTNISYKDVSVTGTLTCNFKITYTANGVNYTSANGQTQMLQRQTTCIANEPTEDPFWGCYIRATDNTPTRAECSGLTTQGNEQTFQYIDADNCVAVAENIAGLETVGAATNGWQGYRYSWRGHRTGVFSTPPTNDIIPPAPLTPPVEPPPEEPTDPTDTATPLQCGAPPDFYTEKYPDGIQGVWDGLKASLLGGALWSGLVHLVPNFQTSSCPVFTLPSMGEAILGGADYPINIPCQVWTWLKNLLLLSASFFAFRLIFGGA